MTVTTRGCAVPYHTIPYGTVWYHTIPYHTIPYHGGEEGSLQEMYQHPKKLLTIPAKFPFLRESVNPCLR